MPTRQGDLALLDDPIAQALLHSQNLARVAYNWTDGTPRVVPIWFTWAGGEIVLASPANYPKVKALQQNSKVAVTIDDTNQGGYLARVLMVRGIASIQMLDDLVPEYMQAAHRYLGDEMAAGWLANVRSLGFKPWARVAIRPEWVAIQDFRQRFPNAMERAMERAMEAAQTQAASA